MDEKININLKDTTEIVCEGCGGKVFTEGVILRKVSRFVTGAEQDQIMPIPVFACGRCAHINDEFIPKGLK